MSRPTPTADQRSLVSTYFFKRAPGEPTERPPEKPRAGSRVRHTIEDFAERRRVRAETDWL